MATVKTSTPVRKVQAGGLAGALVVIVMWLLSLAKPDMEVPPGLEAALTTVFSFVVAYLVPPGASEAVIIEEDGDAKSAKVKE